MYFIAVFFFFARLKLIADSNVFFFHFNRKMPVSRSTNRHFAVRTGLEPATPCVTGMYSNQLNYRTFSHQVTVVTLNCGAKIDSFSYYTIFRFWKNGENYIFIAEENILEGPKIKGYGLFVLRMNGLLIKVIKCRLKFQFTVLECNFFLIFVAHNNCQI